MMTRSKWINIICSLIIGLLFGLTLVVAALMISQTLSSKTDLIVYTESSQKIYDGVPLTEHDWSLEGALKNGHQARAVYKGTRTDAGTSENVIELIITDEMGNDVTDDYRIQYNFGTLTVEARQLLIVGETDGMQDGVLSSSAYQISPNCDGLVIGHKETITLTNGIADVRVFDRSGKDYTNNYFIILQLDGATNIPPSNGDQKITLFNVYSDIEDTVYLKFNSYGDYLGQENWSTAPTYDKLIEDTYSASYLTSFSMDRMGSNLNLIKIQSLCGYYGLPYYMWDGEYEIQQNDISCTGNAAEEYSVYYYHYENGAKRLTGELRSFEKEYRMFVYENYLALDEVSKTYMENLIAVQGFSASDPDVVQKVATFIQNAATYDLEYDKSLETEENVAIAFLESYKKGVCRHYAISATLLFRALGLPARYCVGALAYTEAGEWTEVSSEQAHAWVEVYLDGIGWIYVEVTGGGIGGGGGGEGGGNGGGNGSGEGGGTGKKPITVMPADSRYRYDGKTHNARQKVVGLESFEELGFYYNVKISGERMEAGKTTSVIEYLQLFDKNGTDVTDQYNLKFETGILHVYYEAFDFMSNNIEMIYDGRTLDAPPTVYYDAAKLRDHNLTAEIGLAQDRVLEVGTHLNEFEVKLYQNGQDVTDFYWVKRAMGKMYVKPRAITFKAEDAQKAYDGAPLICHQYLITEGSLGEGHFVGDDIVYTGTQTNIGRSDNEITFIAIYDQNGNNVTKNYSITLLTGKLKVTRQ